MVYSTIDATNRYRCMSVLYRHDKSVYYTDMSHESHDECVLLLYGKREKSAFRSHTKVTNTDVGLA